MARLEVSTAAPVNAQALMSRLEVFGGAQSFLSRIEVSSAVASPRALLSRLEVSVARPPATASLSRLEVFVGTVAIASMSRLSLDTGALTAVITPITGTPASLSQVLLDGSTSTGAPTSYIWTQISGTPANLGTNNLALVGFNVPPTVAGDVLVFQLTVSRGGLSDTSQISIPIGPQINWAVIGGNWLPTTISLL